MGKSTSGKKKRSKYSSRGRTKRRSKNKRSNFKKLRRPDDSRSSASVPSSSEDYHKHRRSRSRTRKDVKRTKRRTHSQSSSSEESYHSIKQKRARRSRNSVSVSSCSEDNHRRRRSRSRTHKDVKRTKRRTPLCPSSSDESYYSIKLKGSKRNDDTETRKRGLRKKRRKKAMKDASTIPRSSRSRSCSTCWSSSSGSDESEYESRRGGSQMREKNLRKLKNVKNGTRKRTYRSRSSSCSGKNGNRDYWSEEKVSGGDISKRLKSVITVMKEDEGRDADLDEHKEEMTYDHDDYPSSRSNDSNEGVNKNVLAHQSHITFEEESSIEVGKRDDVFFSNIKTTYKDRDEKHMPSKAACEGVGTSEAVVEKCNEMSEAVGYVDGDDLESILRQKALENLKRFCGGFQTNAKNAVCEKDNSDCSLKLLSVRKSELSETESAKDDGAEVKGIHPHSLQKSENILVGNNSNDCSVSAKKIDQLPSQIAVYDREICGIPNKPRLVTSALKQALSNCTAATNKLPASQVSISAKLVKGNGMGKHNATNPSSNYDGDNLSNTSSRYAGLNSLQDESKEGSQYEKETPKAVSSMARVDNGSSDYTVNDVSASTCTVLPSLPTPAASSIKLNKEQDDGKESSQLEQKTMSVMRGGEMVQVSYKVYIPKKTPALARRQLKR